jgi:hypothetical protein
MAAGLVLIGCVDPGEADRRLTEPDRVAADDADRLVLLGQPTADRRGGAEAEREYPRDCKNARPRNLATLGEDAAHVYPLLQPRR